MIRLLCRTIDSIFYSRKEDLVLKGILDGCRAFMGPEIVQFDLTNRCNNDCLCCWNNSPLLGEPSAEKIKTHNEELPLGIILKTIGDLKKMGTKSLFLAGGGEPFMHPDIMDILRFAKQCGMKIFINTNFTLIDEKRVRQLVDFKIDLIHVSLLAGTPETYVAIHPNKTESTFYKIKDMLRYLKDYRDEKKQSAPTPFPHIDLYYVIFNKNYRDIDEMVDLAMELEANSLEFMPIDVIPGKTDILLLNELQKKEVLEKVKAQQPKLDEFNKQHGGRVTFIEQYEAFIKRMSADSAAKGEYETDIVTGRRCYVGWAFLRILANGNVNPCLKAHRLTVGNIYKQSIKDIWNSHEQRLFRKKAYALDNSDPYFRMIGNNPNALFGCLNSCDNIQINLDMHEKYADVTKQHGKIK